MSCIENESFVVYISHFLSFDPLYPFRRSSSANRASLLPKIDVFFIFNRNKTRKNWEKPYEDG